LVFHSSTIAMMRGLINIRFWFSSSYECSVCYKLYVTWQKHLHDSTGFRSPFLAMIYIYWVNSLGTVKCQKGS